MKERLLKFIISINPETSCGFIGALCMILGFMIHKHWSPSYTCQEAPLVQVVATATPATGIVREEPVVVHQPAQWHTVDVNSNLRAGASTEHEIVTVITPGTQLIVLQQGRDWSRVSANGKTGYLWNELIRVRHEE